MTAKEGRLCIIAMALIIGEPLYADKSLPPPRTAAERLYAESYRVMQQMNGIFPGDPTYNEDQSIENYRKTM